MSNNFYLLKMDGIQIAVPNELIAKGLDGYKEYASLMRGYYPHAEFTIWEVVEKLVEG